MTDEKQFEVSASTAFNAAVEDAIKEPAPKDEAEDVEESEEADAEVEEDEAGDEPHEADETEEEEIDDKDTKAENAKIAKKLKATLPDGTQVNLTDDAKIKIKVDGQFIKVPVADLISDYNGKVSHAERIRRASEKEKEVQTAVQRAKAEDEAIKKSLKEINTAVTQGNVMRALTIIARMEGQDPQKVMDEWIKGMDTFTAKYSKMTPAEREAEAKRNRLEAENAELKADKEARDQKKRDEEILNFVDQACKAFDLTEDEIINAQKVLKVHNPKHTLTQVVDTALEYKIFSQSKAAAQKLGIELDKEDYSFLIDVIKADQRKNRTRLAPDNFIKWIQAYADKEVKKISVGKSDTKKTTPKGKKEVKELKSISELWG